MTTLSRTAQNDNFMRTMLAKGFETIFAGELPFPMNTRNCSMILARVGNQIHIRSGV